MSEIWPKYDVNNDTFLQYEEGKLFVSEIIGPLINRKAEPGQPTDSKLIFSEEEYKQLFEQIDIHKVKKITKA